MSNATFEIKKAAPITATWVCLAVAWLLFLVPIPGLGLFAGWPLNLVAFILSIVCMARGRTTGGLIPLLSSLIVSPIVYFIGVAIFAAVLGSGDAYKDYKARAEAASNSQQAASSTDTDSTLAAVAASVISVSAHDLFAAYDANEVAADQHYKGQLLKVTGTVDSINKDFSDDVYVELRAGQMFQTIHARGLPPAESAQLSKGQQITVVCKGAGKIVGSPILNDCKL